jgi:hypothetical protein
MMTDGSDLEPSAPPLPRQDVLSDLQIARMLGRVLTLAAGRLNIPFGREVGLDDLCRAILMSARAGGLEPDAYRIIYWILNGPKRIACIEP